MSSSWDCVGVVIVNGLGGGRTRCCIVNVCAPGPLNENRELWGRIQLIVDREDDCCLCIAGDFNSILRLMKELAEAHRFLPAQSRSVSSEQQLAILMAILIS